MHEPRDPPLEVVNVFYISMSRTTVEVLVIQVCWINIRFVRTWGEIEISLKRASRERPLPHMLVTIHSGFVEGQTVMILPQVHLRKPCYDFYFL